VTKKTDKRTIAYLSFSGESKNVKMPLSEIKLKFSYQSTSAYFHLQKINPELDYGDIQVSVRTKEKEKATPVTTSKSISGDESCLVDYSDSWISRTGKGSFGPH